MRAGKGMNRERAEAMAKEVKENLGAAGSAIAVRSGGLAWSLVQLVEVAKQVEDFLDEAVVFTTEVSAMLDAAKKEWKKRHPKEELPLTRDVMRWVFELAEVPFPKDKVVSMKKSLAKKGVKKK